MDEPGVDPKAGERAYYRLIGEAGRTHARAKPFSDTRCGQYLCDVGALLLMMQAPPRRVLEMGCGTGWLSLFLARAGYDVMGVDIAPEAVSLATEAAAEEGLTRISFRLGDYETAPEDGVGAFDYVIFYDALHHAENERDALAAAFASLKPGGAVFAFEPGEGHGASESSRRAVAEYGVHERDMPPHHIAKVGRQVGFQRHLILATPHDLNRTLYRRDFQRQPTQWRLRLEKAWSYVRGTQRLLTQRRGGLTVLWK